jgi:hypothetical protein
MLPASAAALLLPVALFVAYLIAVRSHPPPWVGSTAFVALGISIAAGVFFARLLPLRLASRLVVGAMVTIAQYLFLMVFGVSLVCRILSDCF